MDARSLIGEVVDVRLEVLIPTTDNPRKKPDANNLQLLIASIKSQGIIQPLFARPHPTRTNCYDLRAGWRRYLAAKKLGLETVPVIIREMTDAEAMEVTVTENLLREDLPALDQGIAIAKLLSTEWTVETVASKLGRSEGWVLRRAQLSKLTDRFVTLFNKEGHPFSSASVAVLEQLARLPDDVQKGMAKGIGLADGYLPHWLLGAKALAGHVDRFVTMDLRRVPWKLDDATLSPRAGDCNTCLKRSTAEPRLFDDLAGAADKGPGCCLDAGCFNQKHRLSMRKKIDKASRANPDLVLVTTAAGGEAEAEAKFFGRRVLSSVSVVKCKKGDRGAIASMKTRGAGTGVVSYVRIPAARAGSARAAGSTMSMAQKREGLESRRKAWLIDYVGTVVGERIEELHSLPATPEWLGGGAFLADLPTLGVSFLMPVPDSMPGAGEEAWKTAESYRKSPKGASQLQRDIAAAVLEVWKSRLVRHDHKRLDQFDPDVKRICEYLGLDRTGLVKQAIADIPEPAAWSKTAKPKVAGKSKATKKKSLRKGK